MMRELIISLICFTITFLIAFIAIKIIDGRKLKKLKAKNISEVNYLINKFNLHPSKINYKKMINGIAFINAFIIAFVATIIYLIPLKLFWQLAIGFVLLMVLIYSLYEIYGNNLNKKWGK